MNYMVKSSLLVLIEEESEESLFFPSKLTDYLSLQKPIIGIVPKNCVSRDILQKMDILVLNILILMALPIILKSFPILSIPQKK